MFSYTVSLKNIYRILTASDYPVYSDAVFPRKELKGLTLIRFWKQILPYRWRNTPSGKIIWRTEGSVNRLHSELCNRKDTFRYYKSYSQEIISLIEKEGLNTQIDLFGQFLRDHSYNQEVFQKKMKTFLEMTKTGDPVFSTEAQKWMLGFLKLNTSNEMDSRFLDAWLLTVLTIHAIAGPEMNSEVMKQFRHESSSNPVFINRIRQEKKQAAQQYKLLTNRNSVLFLEPKAANAFFGRQSQLYDLHDMTVKGGKYLLCGVGGVGKTELLRVFLHGLHHKEKRNRIAAVQFEDNLTESFQHAFLDLIGHKSEEILNEVRYILNESPERTILMIDNLDVNALDQKDQDFLSGLQCCVIATSRQMRLKGFEAYPLEDLDDKSSSLVFRSNYENVLSEEEKKKLEKIIRENDLHHPLILTYLGKDARKRHLSMKALNQNVQKMREERTGQLVYEDAFRHLYNMAGVSDMDKYILRLFSLLPYQAYSLEDLKNFTGDAVTQERLQTLENDGWLQENGGLWSMHPVIAENVRTYAASEKDFQEVWNLGEERINIVVRKLESGETLESLRNATKLEALSQADFLMQMRLLFSLFSHIHGPLSRRLLLMGEKCLFILINYGEAGRQAEQVLEKAYENCAEKDAETNLWMCLVRAVFWTNIDFEEINKQINEQLYHQTVSDWLLYYSIQTMISAYQESAGDVKGMSERLQKAFALDVPDSVKNMFYAYLYLMSSMNCAQELNVEGAADSANKLEDIANRLPGKYDDILVQAKTYVAYAFAAVGKVQQAAQYLDDISVQLDEIKNPEVMAIYLQAKGSAESAEGKQEEAAETYQQLIKIMEIQFGKGSLNWCVSTFYYGLTLYRMERYTEAVQAYKQAISAMRKNNPDSVQRMPMLNNLAVVYLDMGQPEKAYPLLEEALPMAEKMGDIGMAECRWNLSRVMRSRGNNNEELELLNQCLPIFQKYYGDENKKTIRCAKRLKEVKEKAEL